MAKRTNYYVLVMREYGPVYVTKLERDTKVSFWNMDEPPLAMTKSLAEDIAFGLRCNGYLCYVVHLGKGGDIVGQPYRYDKGHFVWEKGVIKE